MKAIKIISASAGTGKTHRLAEELYNHIVSGAARPEAILATTFTNKAADELLSRIRRRLLQDGKVSEAHRLGAARIGTVNSVCARLVSDFAFELGLSPRLQNLDENTANAAIRRAMAGVVTDDESAELAELEERFAIGRDGGGWQSKVEIIVARARSNGLSADSLEASADRSVTEFMGLLGKTAKDGAALDRTLQKALATFAANVEPDGVKKTDNALKLARQMCTGGSLPWQSWVKLVNGLDPAKQWQAEAEQVRLVAGRHDVHPRLHEDCERMIRLTFTIAARTLESYRAHKAGWGSIDFVDQEVLALQALSMKEVFDRMAGELDLVLVDEFQDTNPIQLALFLRLAEVAKESIWVGDQKQAIYGFRGTDPFLMDAALTAIEGSSGTPDVLKYSWRSRPELVRLTSELFVPPFAKTGIPPERVRIGPSPRKANEPDGLGPIIERWNLDTKNKADDAAAIAAAFKEALADKTVRVWDKASGQTRSVQAGDMAILCFHNYACANVAAALVALGIPVELAQPGLLSTPEGRLAFAALRLWVDSRDSLAAAELARVIEYPDAGNDWLDAILAKPGIKAFESHPVIGRIREAREAHPAAGAVVALDLVFEAVGIRDLCLRWGDADLRLSNIDALRSHAVGYVSACAAEGAGCTPAGLVAFFNELAGSDLDERAPLPGKNAITVSTWHAAKGREWPFTVIYELDGLPDVSALGVQVVSDAPRFNIAKPLAGRWIRYWPNPYGGASKTPFHERLAAHPADQKACEEAERQNLRLFYVVWTRARDRLVLAARSGQINKGITELLSEANGLPLLSEPETDAATWAGKTFKVKVRTVVPAMPTPQKRVPGEWHEWPKSISEYPPEYVQPSAIALPGRVGAPTEIGCRLQLTGQPDMELVGNALHGFFASDQPSLNQSRRKAIASGLLSRWGVASSVDVDAVLGAGTALRGWVTSNWPDAKWHREWPLRLRLKNGSTLRGIADLVLETSAGYIVIDHKSFPGGTAKALEKAASYVGQILAYAEAIRTATGKSVIGCYIHLPVAGYMVQVVHT